MVSPWLKALNWNHGGGAFRAVMAEHFAREVDFFSIGTNDLTQYTLAADRANAQLADLISAFSPAVLILIGQVIQAAIVTGSGWGYVAN